MKNREIVFIYLLWIKCLMWRKNIREKQNVGKKVFTEMLEVFFLFFLPGLETANVHLLPIAWSALVRLSITAIFGERDGGRIFPHIITPIFTYSLGGEISDGEGEVFLFFPSQCLPLS